MKKYSLYQQKLFINSFLPFLLVFIIGSGVLFTMKKRTQLDKNLNLVNDLQKVYSDLDLVRNSVLAGFCNENGQTQDAELKLQQKISTINNNFIVTTDRIDRAGMLNKESVAEVYDSLKANMAKQVQNVLQLNELIKITGTSSAGLVHDLLNAGGELSESIETSGRVNLMTIMHDLLIAQGSFLNNPGNSTFAGLQSETGTLKDELFMLEEPLPEISEKIENYTAIAGSLLGMAQKIGIGGNGTGLLDEYYSNKKMAAGLINRLETHFTDYTGLRKNVVTILFICINIIVLLAAASLLIGSLRRNIIHPFRAVFDYVKTLATGALPENDLRIKTKDEIAQLGDLLNTISGSLHEKTQFLKTLNEGNLDAKLNLLSKKDILGNALLDIQVAIQKSAEEQQKHDEENSKRRFINEGLAKFSDITHARYETIENLTDLFIKELVKYLDSLQGGVFLTRENEGVVDLYLASAFAYNRKKYLSKTVTMGEGLVGTCALEKRLIMITEVPSDYISITSGLGDAPPGVILLVPMLQDNILAGVLEIASLNTFKDYQLEFVRQVANNLANTLASARINERTSKLLHESQLHAQTMSEQEEEMRQNMEELKATQEESARREEEFKGIAAALEKSVFVAEFDLKGKLISINEKFLVFLGKKQEQVTGKTFDAIIGNEKSPLFSNSALDEVVGGKHLAVKHTLKLGKRKEYSVQFHFSPELNRNDFPFKILCLGIELMS
ncbi:MAG: GAF domain-containing protein [Bacteroidales bacterium]|nr:GAF domain-containing protein [Bacteroidales bacterium]